MAHVTDDVTRTGLMVPGMTARLVELEPAAQTELSGDGETMAYVVEGRGVTALGPLAPEVYRAPAPYPYRGVSTEDALAGLELLFKQDVDPAPYFVGLPGDRCQSAHWGVVTEGQLTFRWPDHDETYMAGDAYYAPPGHLPLVTAGTTIVEFSPTAELEATMSVVQQNLARAGAQA